MGLSFSIQVNCVAINRCVDMFMTRVFQVLHELVGMATIANLGVRTEHHAGDWLGRCPVERGL